MTSKSIDVILTEMEHLKNGFSKLEHKLDSFISTADDKYASKAEHKFNADKIQRIEDNLNRIVWLILAAVCTAILKLVIFTP